MGSGTRLQNIHAVHKDARHAKSWALLVNERLIVPRRGTGCSQMLHADGPFVVLNNKYAGKLVQGRHV